VKSESIHACMAQRHGLQQTNKERKGYSLKDGWIMESVYCILREWAAGWMDWVATLLGSEDACLGVICIVRALEDWGMAFWIWY